MEDYLHKLGERLNGEYSKIHESMEDDIKRLYYNSFSKVAECFGRPGSLGAASQCGDAARAPVESYNQALGDLMGGLEVEFKNCLTSCGLSRTANLDEKMKTCMTKCTDDSIEKLRKSSPKLQELARKHS